MALSNAARVAADAEGPSRYGAGHADGSARDGGQPSSERKKSALAHLQGSAGETGAHRSGLFRCHGSDAGRLLLISILFGVQVSSWSWQF